MTRSLLGLLTAAAFLAAACGGSSYASKNDYVKSLNQAEAALQKSVAGLGSVGANPTGAQAAKTLDAGGDAMTKAADNFNKINPPPDAKHAHGEIVDGLRKFAATFHDAAGKARSNDVKGARDELSGIATSPGAVEIQKAQDELTKAGYKFANG